MDANSDHQVRVAAFDWLTGLVDRYGEVLTRDQLAAGFIFRGSRVPLISPQGIFKPAVMELPLTITAVFGGPYNDALAPDGRISYRYRGTDRSHRDNVGLRKVKAAGLPLIYLHGVDKGKYLPSWPAYVVEIRPDVLEEADGPMLRYGLQGMHRQSLLLPKPTGLHPDRDRLAWRYDQFQRAS